jgi:hypothetical protein
MVYQQMDVEIGNRQSNAPLKEECVDEVVSRLPIPSRLDKTVEGRHPDIAPLRRQGCNQALVVQVATAGDPVGLGDHKDHRRCAVIKARHVLGPRILS